MERSSTREISDTEEWTKVRRCTSMYKVNRKKRDILFLTITLANLTDFYSFCIILIVKKFYTVHATIIKFITSPDLTYIFAVVHKT